MSSEQTTISDVARVAGVSITTVSHVFSLRRPVAPATSARVREVAKTLGYQPDAGARRLGGQRSTTIGLEIDVGGTALALNPWYSTILSELAVSAMERGFTFTLLPTEGDPSTWSDDQLASMAGAVIIDPKVGNLWVPRLLANQVRVVCLGRCPGHEETTWFDNDYAQGAHNVVDHLVANGATRVMMLSSHDRRAVSIDAERGFLEAATLHNVDAEVVMLDELTEACAFETANRFFGEKHGFDGILGATDLVAVGVIKAAFANGMTVPHDVAVAGLGDSILAPHAVCALTSIQSTPKLLTARATEFLSTVWSDPTTADVQEFVTAPLIVRDSTMRRKSSVKE